MPDLSAEFAAAAGPGRRSLSRALRWFAIAIGLTCFTVVVFVVTLAVTMPAPVLATLVVLPPQVETLSGSAWRGRATLAGGHVLDWTISLRQIWRLRLVTDAVLEGAETRLEGVLAISPWRVSALDWEGRASPSLLAFAPRLAVTACTSRAVVAVDRLAFGSGAAAAEGEIGIGQGSCTDPSGQEHPVPAMTLRLATEAGDARAVLVQEDAEGTVLARFGVTGDRRLLVQVEPEGAALVPGMPTSAPISVEYPF